MRFSSIAYVVFASAVAVDAFVPAALMKAAKASSSSAALSMSSKKQDESSRSSSLLSPPVWGQAAMATVVSWGLVAQLASASVAPMLPASTVQGTLRYLFICCLLARCIRSLSEVELRGVLRELRLRGVLA
jgi:hypothetical protein